MCLVLQLVSFILVMVTVIYVDGLSLEATCEDVENGFVSVFEDSRKIITFHIKQEQAGDNVSIELLSSDESVFQVESHQQFLEIEASNTTSFNTTVTGVSIGVEILRIRIINYNANITEFEQVIKVLRRPTILNFIFMYILMIFLIVSYVSMGTKLDLKVIWGNLRRPIGITIGMFCQFIVMPLLAYCLANAILPDNPHSTVGLIVDGSCPGGWFSNIFTLLLDCDFVLSLTMTFCSTIGALAFMPFNLYIYAGTFIQDDEALKTPFVKIIQQFALMLVPLMVGVFIRYKLSKMKDICLCFLKPFALFLIVSTLFLGIPSNLYIFQGSWQIWLVCLLYPLVGGLLGVVLSVIARRKRPQVIAIALETGVQNGVLAITAIRIGYPQPEADLISRIPFLVIVATLFEGCCLVFVYLVYQRFYKKKYAAVNKDDSAKVDENTDSPSDGTDIRLDDISAS